MVDWKQRIERLAGDVQAGIKSAATEVSDGLRIAADDAKKVAGIGVGSIELELTPGPYSIGDSLQGVLQLELSEPTEAKRLVVALRATRQRISFERDAQGKHARVRRNETLHKGVVELGGSREYKSAQFPFAIFLPELKTKVDQAGVLGDVLRAAQALDDMRSSAVVWQLMGLLEIPWRRNLSKKLELDLRPRS